MKNRLTDKEILAELKRRFEESDAMLKEERKLIEELNAVLIHFL